MAITLPPFFFDFMLPYLASWYLKAKFSGKQRPLQTVLFITDKCNLSCSHCSIFNHKTPVMKSYAEIREELRFSYDSGSRFVDFEGGEPTLWEEDGKDINDLVDLAMAIGFYSTTVTTNAQQPYGHVKARSLWVSLDGTAPYHDAIRGQGTFDKAMKNMEASGHPAQSINMVIDADNYVCVPEMVELARSMPFIKSVSFNFYTPSQRGEDKLVLPWDKRRQVLDQIIAFKKAKAPIMNSVSGLKRMKDLSFKKVCWVSNFILADGTRLPQCPGKEAGVCDQCGFCMAGEMRSVLDFRLDTLCAGLNLRQ